MRPPIKIIRRGLETQLYYIIFFCLFIVLLIILVALDQFHGILIENVHGMSLQIAESKQELDLLLLIHEDQVLEDIKTSKRISTLYWFLGGIFLGLLYSYRI